MANRLRAQVNSLITDSSSSKLSVIDASSRLYRIAQFDSSNNATLQNINSILSNKQIYEDKYTVPNPMGPYQVDAIPIALNDKFKLPKYISTTNTTTQNIETTEQFDTMVAPEIMFFVPSKRTTVQTTLAFKQSVSGEVDNLSTFQMSLEDSLLQLGRRGNMSPSLYTKFDAFKTAVSNVATTDASRNALLTEVLNDSDFQFIKNNIKYPFKIWDQVKLTDGSDNFAFDELLDLSGVALKNQLLDGSYYTTKMIRSSWPLDASGNPTEMLPIEQNVNAQGPLDVNTGNNTTPLNVNNKMGLFIMHLGAGNPQNIEYGTTWVPAMLASWGYIVMVMLNSPLQSNWCRISGKKTICKYLSDKTISRLLTSDLSNNYLICPSQAYVQEGTGATASSNRNSGQAFPSLPSSTLLYERSIYQGLCALNKLGIYKYINLNNVVVGGVSAGGRALCAYHNLPSTGITNQFTLNNIDGTSSNIKPFIFRIKALINWQCNFVDGGKATLSQRLSSAENQYNNRLTLGINELTVPMITFTGDGDIYDPRANNRRDMGFNNMAQLIYQITKKSTSSIHDDALARSMVIYSPTLGHGNPSAELDLGDGDFGAVFTNAFGLGWLEGGWKIPKNSTWPILDNLVQTGNLDHEYAYNQYNHVKLAIAMQLAVHRFLGVDYPVPTPAFSALGLRVDLMPTSCDIATHFEYMKVGPTAQISYDASYNIELTTGSNKVSIGVDASKNLLTDATNLIFSNKKLFEDKWSLPYPLGPYHIDAIPMQIKDKFKMSKYSLNSDTDVSGGLVIEPNGFKTVDEYDTPSALDVIVYVPSSRTSRIMTPCFKQDVSSNTNNPGNYNLPLVDFAITYGNADILGDSLWAKVNAFKLNCENTTDPSGLRPGLLNAILSDPEYQLIQQNLKYPFKIWDVSSNPNNFIYENLIDLSGNAMKNILLDSSKFTTQITRSSWEEQSVDASGVPLALQGLSSNLNAQGRKMGILFYWNGTGGAPGPRFHWEAALAASFGYVVVIGNGFPVTGHTFSKLGHTKRTFASLLADKTITQIDKRENALSDINAGHYLYQAVAYGNGLANGLDGVGSYSRAQGQFGPKLPEIGFIYERYFYQIICMLKKLKLYDFIDFNNVVPLGLSAGGQCLVHCHRLLTENTTPNQGVATRFVLNDANGDPTSYKPFLFKSRAMIGHQPALFDITTTKNTTANRRFLSINNRYNLGLDSFTVPTVIITGDYDYWKIFGSIVPQNFFNTMYQTLYQATSKIHSTSANNVMAASAIVYAPAAAHTENPSPYVAGNVDDGLLGTIYSLGFTSSWNKGWELPLTVTTPNIDSILEYGLASEMAYTQLAALKIAIAYQVLIHRFLGQDYPVPVQTLSNLGLRVDLGPTHCDIMTQPSFLQVGPVSEINYDASYNLTVSAPALKLVNRTNTLGVSTDGQSALLSVDASGNLATTANALKIGNFMLGVDASGVFTSGDNGVTKIYYTPVV